MKYKKINLNLRKEIYRRDNYLCQECFEKVILTQNIKSEEDYKKEATLDHIIPKSKGGEESLENLRTLCRSCNSRKKDKNADELKFLNINNGGFTRIHNCLLYTLARVKLNTQESRIFFAIVAKTYGFNKAEDWISNNQLESITGIHRSHCANTVTRLKKRNIVTKTGNKIRLNKYFFSWNDGTITIPKQVTNNKVLPKQVKNVTETGNLLVPKQVPTKETIQKKVNKDEILLPSNPIFIKDKTKKTKLKNNYDEIFEELWKIYPDEKRTRKADSYKEFKKTVKTENDKIQVKNAMYNYLIKYTTKSEEEKKYMIGMVNWFRNWKGEL